MKLKIFISASLLGAAILSGCQKNFLNTTSPTQVLESNFWQTSTDATQGVNAIYNALLANNGFGMFMFNDEATPLAASADAGYSNVTAFTAPGVSSTSGWSSAQWSQFYIGVYRANLALEKIPTISFADTGLQHRLIGEAKFLRALNYLYLISQFGDVPLLTHTLGLSEAQTPQVTRTPIAQVRAQIYSDLDSAAMYLPVTYSSTDIGRATKYAALSLKGRAQLYEGNYAGAAATLNTVIQSGTYTLYANYFNLFDHNYKNNAECIFSVQYANTTGTGFGNQFEKYIGNRSGSANGWTWLMPTLTLVDNYQMIDGLTYDKSPLFDPANPYNNRDPRMDFTIIRPGAIYNGKLMTLTTSTASQYVAYDQKSNNFRTGYLTRKALSADAGGASLDGLSNLILIRYADVLLMYAEAQNEVSGPDATVYNAIKSVRQRPSVNMPVIPAGLTQDSMRSVIRHERMVELALEGHYYFDLKRWNLLDKVDLTVSRPLTDTSYTNRAVVNPNRIVYPQYYLLPIPQSEIFKNPKLLQNSGYN